MKAMQTQRANRRTGKQHNAARHATNTTTQHNNTRTQCCRPARRIGLLTRSSSPEQASNVCLNCVVNTREIQTRWRKDNTQHTCAPTGEQQKQQNDINVPSKVNYGTSQPPLDNKAAIANSHSYAVCFAPDEHHAGGQQ